MNRAERMRTLGVLFAISAVVVVFFGYSSIDISRIYSSNPLWSSFFGIFLLLIIVFTFFSESVDDIYKNYKNKKNKLSNTVISKRTSVIHVLDVKGENASYFEKVLFYKIDKKNPYISDIFADESNPKSYISNPQLANCTTNFSKNTTHLEISFKDKMEELNEVQSSYKVEKFLYVSVELKNCFTDTTQESWQFKIKNYCKEFEQKIKFPNGVIIEQVRLYKIKDNKETVVTAVTPIIIKENIRESIYLYLTNLDKNECFELRWSYGKNLKSNSPT